MDSADTKNKIEATKKHTLTIKNLRNIAVQQIIVKKKKQLSREVKDFSSQNFSSDTLQEKSSE